MPFGLIPQENSTNGSVIETYNILRVPAFGQETFVRGATVLEVKHSLVTRRGVKLEDIETVMSHEQVRRRHGHHHLDGVSHLTITSSRLWDNAESGYPHTCLEHRWYTRIPPPAQRKCCSRPKAPAAS